MPENLTAPDTVEAIPTREGGPGRPPKYDYDNLFDGEPKVLRKGKHFDVEPASMSGTVRSAAKRKGLEVIVAVRGEKVYVQKVGILDEDEVTAEAS